MFKLHKPNSKTIGNAAVMTLAVLALSGLPNAGIFEDFTQAAFAKPETAVDTCEDPEFRQALIKHMEKRFFARIDATDEQQTQIKAIIEKSMSENQDKKKAMRTGVKELLAMVQGDAKDEEIKAKVKDLRAIHESLTDARIESMLSIRKTLNDEQRAKLGSRFSEILSKRGII